jgi:hypothetical protein
VAEIESDGQITIEEKLNTTAPTERQAQWTRGICPRCGYAKADVDPGGVIWCPACGYSQKGCYT